MQDLNDMLFFAEVVERGGFAAAGRALGVPKSRLSRRVATLEMQLGVRLLQRTTRSLALTEVGQAYLRHCQELRTCAESAADLVASVHTAPRGTIHVSCPVTLAQTVLAELLPQFLLRHPQVRIEMQVSNRAVNLVEEGVDVALRVRHSVDDSASLVVKRLDTARQVLVASPVLLQRQNCTIHSKTLRVLGGESSIASKVSPLFASENPTAAIYCKTGESEIRVTARAATEAEAETACDARIAEFRKILGPNAYDVDVPGLEYTVVHLLQQKGLHAATAESCTGGLVAEKITNVPGSSEVFGYGFVTYAEAAKAKLLGVDPTLIEQYNVVSGPVAVAMAYGALQASGADLAVGITGIAGPGGALPGKPVCTVYLAGADARSGKAWLMRLELGGYAERSIIRTRAALYALDLLRRMALDIPPENAHPVPSKDVKPETLDI